MSSLVIPSWQDVARETLAHLGVELGKEQAEVFYDEASIKVLAGGEGSGKSFLSGLYGTCRSIHDYMLHGPQLYWIVGADFEDARKEFGGTGAESEQYLLEWMDRLGVYDRARSSISVHRDLKCILKTKGEWLGGHTFETVSGYDPLKIGREQPMGVMGAEASRWVRELWDRCIGRLARKSPYSWGFFSGSFEEGFPAFREYFNMGQAPNLLHLKSYSLPSWCNPSIYPGGRTDPAILALESVSSPEWFMERYGGRPAPPRNAIFPEFQMSLHVLDTPLIRDYPIYLFVDPGDTVYAVLFVQLVGEEVWVVDEVYTSHWTHEQVIQACQMKAAWALLSRSGHVADVAAAQRHFGFGSPLEAWYRDTGISFFSNKILVEDSIERVRSVLAINPKTGRPRLRISPKCVGLISEMGGGPSPVPGGGAWKFKGGVAEARNDHACKALAYGLVHHFGTARPGRRNSEDDEPVSYLRRKHEKAR